MILVDSNILIDLIADDPVWADWSSAKLEYAAAQGEVAINPIVIAEVGPSFDSLETFRQRLDMMGLSIEPLTDHGAFLAGAAFRRYKALRDGARTILADFLIGDMQSRSARPC